MLAPSCWLAEHVGGPRLSWEPFAGFISHEGRMVVGVPCSGISFLVVAWLALYFTCQGSRAGLRGKLAWWALSLGGAYLATIVANGTRIALATRLHALDLSGLVSEERAHRGLGVVVYCAALLSLCRAARWLAEGRARSAYFAPLACYAGITAGIPIAQTWLGSARVPWTARTTEHVTQTLVAGSLCFLLAWLVGRARDRLCSRHAR